jgi:hypothetical protein
MNRTDTQEKRVSRHRSAATAMRFCGMMFARLFFVIGFALILAFAVVWLWNRLMPGLFGLGLITYWQAFGLMILARLVLGTLGFGLHGYRMYDRRPWGDRFTHHHSGCGPMGRGADVNSTMKWWHNYKQFWKDEGKAAFDEYLKRTGGKRPTEPADDAGKK